MQSWLLNMMDPIDVGCKHYVRWTFESLNGHAAEKILQEEDKNIELRNSERTCS